LSIFFIKCRQPTEYVNEEKETKIQINRDVFECFENRWLIIKSIAILITWVYRQSSLWNLSLCELTLKVVMTVILYYECNKKKFLLIYSSRLFGKTPRHWATNHFLSFFRKEKIVGEQFQRAVSFSFLLSLMMIW
jgi:hypothetical protein